MKQFTQKLRSQAMTGLISWSNVLHVVSRQQCCKDCVCEQKHENSKFQSYKEIFSLFFFCVVVVAFFAKGGGGNIQFSAYSSRLFHHTSESFSKRKDICFLMAASVRSRWLDIGRVLFLRFMELDFISVYKNARKQRGHIN